jgi:hypothetical protein
MSRFNVRHHQAVWETTSFIVEVPEGEADPEGWINERFNALLSTALSNDTAQLEWGTAVDTVDSELEIEPVR